MPIKRKATAKKVGKKAAAASPERDTKAVRTPPAATKAKARLGEEAGPAPARPGRRQGPEVTHEKALLRDDFGKEDGPAREREQPEELICGAAADDLAEELGEEFVRSATSGEQAAQDIRDEEVPEESGGPFVETSGRSEFAYGTGRGLRRASPAWYDGGGAPDATFCVEHEQAGKRTIIVSPSNGCGIAQMMQACREHHPLGAGAAA
jgi:hypothetical protein